MVDLDHLREHGYVVVPGVVDRSLTSALVDLLRDEAGLDVDDPSTWERATSFSPPVWGHQLQWEVRQLPEMHAAFAEIYGREDLIVSQDGMGFKPPVSVAATRTAKALPIHWDFPPTDPRKIYQGVLYLTDVEVGGGAFCCVPGIYRELEGYVARHPGVVQHIDDLEGHPVVEVPGRAGDLVIFDGHLPHGNGENVGEAPRVAQYVSMWPADFWGQPRSHYAKLYETGTSDPGFQGRPGWDRPQPWPPAELSPLGRRLAGVDAWE